MLSLGAYLLRNFFSYSLFSFFSFISQVVASVELKRQSPALQAETNKKKSTQSLPLSVLHTFGNVLLYQFPGEEPYSILVSVACFALLLRL